MEYVTKLELQQQVDRLDRRIEAVVGALEDRMIGRMAEMESRIMRYVDRRIDEAVTAIQATLLEHERRFDDHDKRFAAIEARLDAHERRFEAIEATLAEHGRRLSALEENVQTIIKTQGEILAVVKDLARRLPA